MAAERGYREIMEDKERPQEKVKTLKKKTMMEIINSVNQKEMI